MFSDNPLCIHASSALLELVSRYICFTRKSFSFQNSLFKEIHPLPCKEFSSFEKGCTAHGQSTSNTPLNGLFWATKHCGQSSTISCRSLATRAGPGSRRSSRSRAGHRTAHHTVVVILSTLLNNFYVFAVQQWCVVCSSPAPRPTSLSAPCRYHCCPGPPATSGNQPVAVLPPAEAAQQKCGHRTSITVSLTFRVSIKQLILWKVHGATGTTY